MISVTSGLSLKLYLSSLVYDRTIFGSSSKVFGNFRKSLDIFGNFRKFLENVRERSSGLRNNFGKSSDIFGRWSEVFGKSSKRRHAPIYCDDHSSLSKRTLHVSSKMRSLVRYCSRYLNIKFVIFSPPCNILYEQKY